ENPWACLRHTQGQPQPGCSLGCSLRTFILANRHNEERRFVMECPACQNPARRFGTNRNGSQRYRCDVCRRTFTDNASRPVDRRRIPEERLVLCLRLLLEGNSVRSSERLAEVHRDTILSGMVEAGLKCQRFLERVVRDVPVEDVQADEI